MLKLVALQNKPLYESICMWKFNQLHLRLSVYGHMCLHITDNLCSVF